MAGRGRCPTACWTTSLGAHPVLLERLDAREIREWYAAQAVHHDWSRNVLEHHIRTDAHARLEAAPSNFAATLPAEVSR